MSDSYLFDKRRMKRGFIKYGIIFLISFVPLVLFNIYIGSLISANWVVVFLDCVILLVFVVIGSSIANKIFAKQDAKRDARIRERESINRKKQQVMEASYKKKRLEKQSTKQKETKSNVEIIEPDVKKTKNSKKTNIDSESKGVSDN